MKRLQRLIVWAIAAQSIIASEPAPRERYLIGQDQRRSTAGTRIVGGTDAAPGQYPYYVQMNGCGATLIYSDIILSAAHCNAIASNAVLVGPYLSQSTQGGAVFRTIVTRKVHPNYNASTLNYDFLVMKLNKNVTQTPISINSNPKYPAVNQPLTVIGLGVTSEGGTSLSPTLQQVTVNMINQQTCSSSYKGMIDANTMMCAGVSLGGKDSCQGDSGGPVFDSNRLLVGSVSFGHGCGRVGYPGVYSRVSGAYTWINQQICALSSNPPLSCSKASSLTPPPVVTPRSCSDASSNFVFGSTTRSCSWLKKHFNQYGYLCTQSGSTAAAVCSLTCGIC